MDKLSTRIAILQNVFGEKELIRLLQKARCELDDGKMWEKNTIERSINDYLKDNKKKVSKKGTAYWAKATGMQDNLFDLPLVKFIEELYKHKHKKNTPISAYYLCRKYGENQLPMYHRRFSGYHYGWFPWPNNNHNDKNFYKVLIKIKEIVPEKRMIDVEMITEKYIQQSSSFKNSGEWGYKGRLLPLVSPGGGGLCLFLEHINQDMGIFSAITILLNRGDPNQGIWGIYTAEPALNENNVTIPCAARFFMKKLGTEEQNFSENILLNEIGWRDKKQFLKETGQNSFSNNLNEFGVLVSTPS